MYSDEDIKITEGTFSRPGDEIISIRGVCLNDKFMKKDLSFQHETITSTSRRNYLDISRPPYRDGFLPENMDQTTARFAWTEEDGNIASLVSEPGFGTTGQTTFGKDLDAAFKNEMKDIETSSGSLFQASSSSNDPFPESNHPIIPSSGISDLERPKGIPGACKIDKADPRARYHFVKYVKRQGKTIKVWECGICSREFQHQYTLLRHLPTHTDERNFHCNDCGKSFRQLSTLSQHRAIHSVERPYSCEVCNKTFNRVSTLISHRKTHSDQKTYRCNICNKGFHQKGNLRNHLFTHTNERPYQCNICFKGFNQQSNLTCHKKKAHPDKSCSDSDSSIRNTPQTVPITAQLDSARHIPDHPDVIPPVRPYYSTITPASWVPKEPDWEIPKAYQDPNGFGIGFDGWGAMSNGVIVDQIKTYHMEVALAMKQTPFALLKPDNGNPVLVKVVDTTLPGGKQMLVPATAEDLRVGGKIVVNNDNEDSSFRIQHKPYGFKPDSEGAVQIRVPVVATVVPRIKPGGGLHLVVEEPHHAYHTALTADVGALKSRPCASLEPLPGPSAPPPPLVPRPIESCSNYEENTLKTAGSRIPWSCALLPPAPSPPLDLISLDVFEPIESIGPQITPVENQPPPSDDSDIFIGQFEVGIPLSDSD